jgi:trk system potassium uptake protein TrkA
MIAGAGAVGYSLAWRFSYKHNVIVVDKDIQKLDRIEENLDILTLLGNIEDPKTYQSLHFKEIDLFIAVTNSDEANLLSTLIVDDEVSVDRKIIRLKNDYFANSQILKKLKIDDVVFPDVLTAQKVESLFNFPKANNVKSFIECGSKLISIKIQYDTQMRYRVCDFINEDVAIVGIERKKDFFIPSSFTIIEEDDLIYFFGNTETITKLSLKLNRRMPLDIKKVVVFGANSSAQKIVKSLLNKNLDIKIIEKNSKYCEIASELLQDSVTVINSKFEEHKIFDSERLKDADIVIAAGENDEKNIVKCIEAKEYGIQKVVAINNDNAYYSLMHQLGIVVVRGAKTGAHYAILEMIASSSIVNENHFCGGKGVVFLRKIYPNSSLIDKKIKALNVEESLFYQLSNEKLYTQEELMPIKEGDTIIVFGKTENEDEIQKWIYSL